MVRRARGKTSWRTSCWRSLPRRWTTVSPPRAAAPIASSCARRSPPADSRLRWARSSRRRSGCGFPMMAMVRPRAGGFCYSEADFAVMRRDAGDSAGARRGRNRVRAFSIPTGALTRSAAARCSSSAGGKQTVFHRAFDVVPDPNRALDELIDLGFTRVLTSGQQKTALEGRELIARLIARAGERIEVLPGWRDSRSQCAPAGRGDGMHAGPHDGVCGAG